VQLGKLKSDTKLLGSISIYSEWQEEQKIGKYFLTSAIGDIKPQSFGDRRSGV